MSKDAGSVSWHRTFDAHLVRFQLADIGLCQMVLVWAAAIIVVVLACVVFFFALYWLVS